MKLPTLDKFPAKVLAKIDIQRAFAVSRLVIAAERLQVFRLLGDKRINAAIIGRQLRIHSYFLKPFLDALASLGLLGKAKDTYWNTRFAKHYFIEERSIYWTRQYSKECVQAYEGLTLLEKSLASGRRYRSLKGLKVPSYTEEMVRDRQRAADFTQMLFYLHRDDAKALARFLDLSKRKALLDVGGGSGVMSIALARKNPHLRVDIFDIGTVCKIAAKNVRRAGLSGRVGTTAGDIREGLPAGYDAMLFCDVGPVSKEMLRSAYKSLPAKGLLVLADRYLSRKGTDPLDRVVQHFGSSAFGLETWAEMVERVKSCGFEGVKAENVYRDAWFITARKPAHMTKRQIHS